MTDDARDPYAVIEELKGCAESADWAKAEKLAHWLAQSLRDRDRREAARRLNHIIEREKQPDAPKPETAEGRVGHCPQCDSPAPKLHPAMQFEGEVQPCPHPFHQVEARAGQPRETAEGSVCVHCERAGAEKLVEGVRTKLYHGKDWPNEVHRLNEALALIRADKEYMEAQDRALDGRAKALRLTQQRVERAIAVLREAVRDLSATYYDSACSALRILEGKP